MCYILKLLQAVVAAGQDSDNAGQDSDVDSYNLSDLIGEITGAVDHTVVGAVNTVQNDAAKALNVVKGTTGKLVNEVLKKTPLGKLVNNKILAPAVTMADKTVGAVGTAAKDTVDVTGKLLKGVVHTIDNK